MKTAKEESNILSGTLPLSGNPMLKIAFSPIYKYELPEGHRFPLEEYKLIPERMLYEGNVQEDCIFHP